MERDSGRQGRFETLQRYSAVAIALHWLIAAALLFQIALGWRMADAEGASHAFFLRAHRTVGIAILLLSLARLAWRLVHRPPDPDVKAPALERLASQAVHRAFYVALIGLPLTGWALVSTTHGRSGWYVFGTVRWPDLPFLGHHAPGVQDALATAFNGTHTAMVWGLLGLLALHLAGALKHQFFNRDRVLARMVPGIPPNSVLTPRVLLIPVALAAAAAMAYVPTAPSAPQPRPPVTQLDTADVYLDIVEPMLRRRCQSCHDEDQSRGGLSVTAYADLAVGGNTGPAIVPGVAGRSELLRRITRTPDREGFMPPDGKTPLTPEQVRVLQWWVSAGAPQSGALATFRPSGEAQIALRQVLGLVATDGDSQDHLVDQPPLGLKAADPAVVLQLESQGFVVRPIATGSPLVDVDFNAAHPVSEAQIALLAKIGPQLRGLNLRAAGIHDAQLRVVGGFANLSRLRIEQNDITDTGIAHLYGLRKLIYLNLVGTRVTDTGLAALAQMPSLRKVFVWGTTVTAARVAMLQKTAPTLEVDTGAQSLTN